MVIRSDCMLLHWNEFARILLDFDKVIIVVDDKEKNTVAGLVKLKIKK